MVYWLAAEHALAVLTLAMTLLLVASVLRKRQPASSAVAWLLAIVLIPYVGIPLYLSLGRRKVERSRSRLDSDRGSACGEVGRVGERLPGPVGYHDLSWLEDGVQAYRALRRAIESARHSIRISTFVIGGDEVGVALVTALAGAAARGVAVHLLVDDFLWRQAPREQIRTLSEAGGSVARFARIWHLPFRRRTDLRNHRKIALFDASSAVVGGMNLASEYMGPTPSSERWRDCCVGLGGPVAGELDAVFRRDWAMATGEDPGAARGLGPPDAAPCDFRGQVRVIASGPDSASDPLYDELLTLLFRARERIWLATPYFVPDEPICRALEIAVRRGVHVLVLVPLRSNHPLADLVGASNLRALAEAGVDVRFYRPTMLHAKAALFDRELVVVGSANIDMRSLFLDYEISLLFSEAALADSVERWFRTSLLDSRSGMAPAGAVRRGAEAVARLLAPLM